MSQDLYTDLWRPTTMYLLVRRGKMVTQPVFLTHVLAAAQKVGRECIEKEPDSWHHYAVLKMVDGRVMHFDPTGEFNQGVVEDVPVVWRIERIKEEVDRHGKVIAEHIVETA